ncbi:hypothetical protein D9M68_495880 [compost metagenome]
MQVRGQRTAAGGFDAGLARFEQREERRHACAARDPYLPAAAAALAVEAAIGAFDIHMLACPQALAQTAGVVAQRLDDQTQQGLALFAGAQAAGRAGDGEGMRAFAAVKAHERELPGAMPRPAGRQGADHFDRRALAAVAQDAHRLDAARMAARPADPARQRPQCCGAAQQQQGAHEQAQGQGPEVQGHQRHRMKRQRQEQKRHGTVQEPPGPVGQQPGQQRQRHHGQQEVKSPFAQVLGQAAEVGKPRQHGIAAGPAGGSPQCLDRAAGFLGAPVQEGGDGRADAGPLVQSIHLVHAAQRTLQPRQAQRQQHCQAHQANAPQSGKVQGMLAQSPPARRGALRVDEGQHAGIEGRDRQPCQGNAQQPDAERHSDTHDVLPVRVAAPAVSRTSRTILDAWP